MTTQELTARAVPSIGVRARDVIASEWTKFRSVRSTNWTLLIAAVTAIGGSTLTAVASSARGRSPIDPMTRIFIAWLEYPVLAVGILGVLVFTAECSSGQIRMTFVSVPRRRAVLAAKAFVLGVVTLIVGEILAFICLFLAWGVGSSERQALALSHPRVLGGVLAGGFTLAVVALLGLGIGAIIRHTAGAVAALPAVLYLPLVVLTLPTPWNDRIGKFTLVPAAYQVVTSHPSAQFLSPPVSLVVLIAWPAIALAIAAILVTRRDA
jgi:ABC-type transport system involved in multi-copper enzyme maturation permease subunit